MKTHLLIIIFFFSAFQLSSQEVRIEGSVVDSLEKPIEMANILALQKDGGSMVSFAISDQEGRFRIDIPQGEEILLKISYLGFRTEEIVLLPGVIENKPLHVVLLEDEELLQAVDLTYQIPVVKRGDTLVYDADSFRTGNERKLGDLLKNMPGIEVNKDGQIEVEGKKVEKVMIEGKNFFSGDSKLATKNIPADAISKVEVLKNFSDVKQLKGLGNEEKIAINLKLKEGKKRFWFGNVESGAGYGEKGRYMIKPKAFYYSPRSSMSFLSNWNNIGDEALTANDYFSFTGNFLKTGNDDTSFSENIAEIGLLTGKNDHVKDYRGRFEALNFSHQPLKSWSINGYGLTNNFEKKFHRESLRKYIEAEQMEFITDDREQDSRLAVGNFSTKYQPSSTFQLNYDILIKYINSNDLSNTVSSLDNEDKGLSFFERRKSRASSLKQTLDLYHSLNDNNIMAGYFSHVEEDHEPFYNLGTNFLPFTGTLPINSSQDAILLNQKKFTDKSVLSAQLDYFYILNRISHLRTGAGYLWRKQTMESNIFQKLDNGKVETINIQELFRNWINYEVEDYFVELEYKLKTGNFTVAPGLAYHQYKLFNEQKEEQKNNKALFLPQFFLKYELGNSENLRFNYRVKPNFPDISELAEGFILENYNHLYSGNRNLEHALNHHFTLSYLNFDLYHLLNIFGSINYSLKNHSIGIENKLEGIEYISKTNNLSDGEDLAAFGSVEKTFKNWKLKFRGNQVFSKYPIRINEELQSVKTSSTTLGLNLLSNFEKSPHFEVGFEFILNDYQYGNKHNSFMANRPFMDVQLRFLNNFLFNANWNYNFYSSNSIVDANYSFLNFDLFYKTSNSNWEFGIVGKNLLDVETINKDSFNQLYTITTSYSVQPQMFLFLIKYDI